MESTSAAEYPLITVFTPTYNRAHTLHRVFDSLCAQTLRNFEWLVVDDGSTDSTPDLIAALAASANFAVRYFRQDQSGKHIAHNLAAREARGKFFVVLDSDDACVPNALEKMAQHWNTIPVADRVFFSGVQGLCTDQWGRIVGDQFPSDPIDITVREKCYVYRVQGEKWGSTLTDVIRQFPFPEIRGTYIPEGLLWLQIGKQYKNRCVNDVFRIYYINDCQTGLTISKRIRDFSDYARGRLHFYTWLLNNDLEYITRAPTPFLKAAVILPVLAYHAGQSVGRTLWSLHSIWARILLLLALPLSFFVFFFNRLRFRPIKINATWRSRSRGQNADKAS